MFFNENFTEDIVPLATSFRHSNYCKTTDNKRYEVKEDQLVNLSQLLYYFKNNYKFNVIEFIEYGQRRGKKWEYMKAEEYSEASSILPKPKKKFINPKRRRVYAFPK